MDQKLKDFEKEIVEHEWEADMLAYIEAYQPDLYIKALKGYYEFCQKSEEEIEKESHPIIPESLKDAIKDFYTLADEWEKENP